MTLEGVCEVALFAGIPFCLACPAALALFTALSSAGKKKRRSSAAWLEKHMTAVVLGVVFAAMLTAAIVVCLICVRLSAPVRSYYIICGAISGAASGAAIAFLKKSGRL